MQAQEEKDIICPYCWQSITILVDQTIEHQEYIEDCQVCCNPILINVTNVDGNLSVDADKENS